jgi:hypothetical protein
LRQRYWRPTLVGQQDCEQRQRHRRLGRRHENQAPPAPDDGFKVAFARLHVTALPVIARPASHHLAVAADDGDPRSVHGQGNCEVCVHGVD